MTQTAVVLVVLRSEDRRATRFILLREK